MRPFRHPKIAHLSDYSPTPETEATARRIDELADQQKDLLRKSQQVLASADRAGRALDETERHAVRRRAARVEELEDEIDSLINEVNNQPSLPRRTPADAAEPLDFEHSGIGVVRSTHRDTAPTSAIGTRAALAPYAAAARASSGHGPFTTLGSFAKAVAARDPRLYAAASLQGTTYDGPGGGYAVPAPLLYDLMQEALALEVVRPRAKHVTMPTGVISLPRFDDRDRSGGDHAGMHAYTVSEGVDAPLSKPKLATMTLTARKQVVMVPCTSELVHDAGPNFETLLRSHMAAALAAKVDDSLLVGALPALGVLAAPATIEVAKESGQPAATLRPENIVKMLSRLAPESFASAVWVAHPSTIPALFLMQTLVRNQANNDNVGGGPVNWFTMSANGEATLLGRPLLTSDRLMPLGSRGDLVLADFSKFIVGTVPDARLAVSEHAGFQADEVWFRLTLRIDGQPLLASPIVPRRGNDTLSHFIVLAERS